jgi:hypothetical protein
MNTQIRAGEEILIGTEPHYVVEIKEDGVVLKTYNEIYHELNCRKCRYFRQHTGYLGKEKTRVGEKMPLVFGCLIGQFPLTHKITNVPKVCNVKNLTVEPVQTTIDNIVEKTRKMFAYSVYKNMKISKILIPGLYGVNVVDVEKCEIGFRLMKGKEENETK